MTIPDELLGHTATATPAVGDPFDFPCCVLRAQDFPVDPRGDDSVPAYTILANPDVTVPAGTAVEFSGQAAVVVKIIAVDDGGITDLGHQELTAVALADLAEAQALQEAQMTSVCEISRNTGTTVYDPVTHQDEQVWTPVYTGKCFIQPAGRNTPLITPLAGQRINSEYMAGAVPVTVTDLRSDDVAKVTASEDPGQVGKQYVIETVLTSATATARRFLAVDNQG